MDENKNKKRRKSAGRRAVKIVIILLLAYLLIPSYIIAIGIKMPFPYILFPPLGKHFLYDEENYSCLEQSMEVEKFLEGLGIHVYGKSGYAIDKEGRIKLKVNATTGKVDYKLLGDYTGHRWIVIDLGIIQIPFDATSMTPLNPAWFYKYNVIIRDEGMYDGKHEISRDDVILEKIVID